MDPWELVLAHRYEEALADYDAQHRAGATEDALELANRSTVLLCLGKLTDALEGFRKANELAAQRLRGESQPYLKTIGTILWLLGKRDEAIQTFKAAVDGVLNGSIKFADSAGGASQGLLLWYAGVTAADDAAKEYSLKYLRKLAKKPRIKQWPGTLARFVLGEKTQRDVLLEACGAHELDAAISQARADLLKRRCLVSALFYFAVCKRSDGCEKECQAGMARCATLENPIIEMEWYLAHAEAKQESRKS